MQINSYNSMAPLSSGNICNAKSSEQNISNAIKKEFDIVEISSKTVTKSEETNKSEYSDEEIAEFLKDKPYTAFKYEYYDKYGSDYAKKFVTNEMKHYYEERFNPIRNQLVFYDRYAISNNMTSEDIKADLNKYNLLKRATKINSGLYGIDSVMNYREDHGVSITLGIKDSFFNYFGYDASIMYQDIKVDKNGQVMILPKESDKWLTREEFIAICPDYEMFSTRDISNERMGGEHKLALAQGEEVYKKFVENFIAELSEEEKQLLKDNDIFAYPAFATLGIKGIEQFTKDIENIKTAKIQKWTGLNQRREELIKLAEKSKQNFAKEKAAGIGNVSLYEVIPYYSGYSKRDAKLIAELGLSDYIKIDASKIDLEKGLINGYRLDMDFINEYSECFYLPERDNGKYRYLDFKDGELEQALMKYGSSKNIEKAYLYAINNNLSLDILSNDYSSLIGRDNSLITSNNSSIKSDNLNGRDDFLTSLFSETNNKEIDENIGLVLDLKSKYLSKINKDNNIDILLDIL